MYRGSNNRYEDRQSGVHLGRQPEDEEGEARKECKFGVFSTKEAYSPSWSHNFYVEATRMEDPETDKAPQACAAMRTQWGHVWRGIPE